MPRIFISYRTDDAGQAASRLFDDLTRLFGSGSAFIDHTQISGGEAWAERLTTEAARAAVMFVLIGSGWLKAQNPTTGDRRLNEPDDWVRREIQTALDAGVLVVPVLVDDARPLTAIDLRTVPEIQKLAEKQSLQLRRKDWDTDVAHLQGLLLQHGIAPSGESALARDHQTTSALSRTYTDSDTGLMWTIRDNGKGLTWFEAVEYAKQFRVGGYSDWRLPTVDELEELHERGTENAIRPPFRVHALMWSSTTSGETHALFYNYWVGTRGTLPKDDTTNQCRAFCVRSVEPQ